MATTKKKTTKIKTSDDRSLKKYRARRDMAKTPEPKGVKRKSSKEPLFVIQKHDASHLHYDLRLEVNGVMPSWAVPKGPSLNSAIKRLAIQTEDHPLDYAYFEGVIPKGEYGGGTVMVWDIGTYKNIKEKNGKLVPMKECIKMGTLEFFLEGKKLQGAFALIKTHQGWLLIKMHDEYSSARKNPVNTQNKSALTGRTMTQITKDGLKGEER